MQYNEVEIIFNERLGMTYGDMSEIDYQSFLVFLLSDSELEEQGWEFGQELPFDLEALIDEWIEQDEIYKPFN